VDASNATGNAPEPPERPLARRRRSSAGTREHRTVIRHSSDEWAEVSALAADLGVSVPGLYELALAEKRHGALQARTVDEAPDGDGGIDADDVSGTRRRRNPTGARPHRTVIRHTDEEWARVTSMASYLGLSVPGFYERAAFAGSAQAAVELSIIHDELFGVRRLLANAANNLNQVARSLNTDGTYDDAQLVESLRLFRETIARLHRLLDDLPGGGMQA